MIPTIGRSPRFGEILVDEAHRTRYLPSLISFEVTGEHLQQLKDVLDKGKNDRYISLRLKQEHKNGGWTYSVTQNDVEIGQDKLNRFIPLVRQAALSTRTKELILEHLENYALFKHFTITA